MCTRHEHHISFAYPSFCWSLVNSQWITHQDHSASADCNLLGEPAQLRCGHKNYKGDLRQASNMLKGISRYLVFYVETWKGSTSQTLCQSWTWNRTWKTPLWSASWCLSCCMPLVKKKQKQAHLSQKKCTARVVITFVQNNIQLKRNNHIQPPRLGTGTMKTDTSQQKWTTLNKYTFMITVQEKWTII